MSSYAGLAALITAAAACVAGCDASTGSRAFTLPPGDVDAGRAVFLDMACNDCHSIVDEQELRADWQAMDVPLGGPTSRVKSYGELVTSVINPSHRVSQAYQGEPFTADGDSRMRNYNQVMTVRELIDVVTYLQDQYDLVEHPVTQYSIYNYP